MRLTPTIDPASFSGGTTEIDNHVIQIAESFRYLSKILGPGKKREIVCRNILDEMNRLVEEAIYQHIKEKALEEYKLDLTAQLAGIKE